MAVLCVELFVNLLPWNMLQIGSISPSPNHQMLAWTEDTTGNEKYTLHVKVGQAFQGLVQVPSTAPAAHCHVFTSHPGKSACQVPPVASQPSSSHSVYDP